MSSRQVHARCVLGILLGPNAPNLWFPRCYPQLFHLGDPDAGKAV